MIKRPLPVRKPIYKSGQSEESTVADQGRKRNDKHEYPDYEPSGGDLPPFFSNASQPVEYGLVVDQNQQADDEVTDKEHDDAGFLQRRKTAIYLPSPAAKFPSSILSIAPPAAGLL